MVKQSSWATTLTEELQGLSCPKRAEDCLRFFKTGPGQYGEGDHFLGVPVPQQRKLMTRFWQEADLTGLEVLLASPWHEVRLSTLFLMVKLFQTGLKRPEQAPIEPAKIIELYESSFERINNWDLVDASAHYLTGAWYLKRSKQPEHLPSNHPFRRWARTDHLWTQRIAMVSTWAFIRQGIFKPTLELSRCFLNHPHDLIHKATGWMLREVGKRDEAVLTGFLDISGAELPRTALRYAIERLDEPLRKHYLSANRSQAR